MLGRMPLRRATAAIAMADPRPAFVRATGKTLAVGLSLCALIGVAAGSPVAGATVASDRAHCPRFSQLATGKRAGAIDAGRSFLHDSRHRFELVRAHRARQGDLGFERYRAACGSHIVGSTWYVELHPPVQRMPCSACNSHLYAVKYRRTGWRILVYFSG
jgi:hypothetical protein